MRRARMATGSALLLGAAGLLAGMATAQDEDGVLSAGNPALAPYKYSGLYYFETGPDNAGSCTAQFIAERVLLTAAHCVQDQQTGRFYDADHKHSIFLLQYQNEEYSDRFHTVCTGVFPGWVVKPKPGEDFEKPNSVSVETRKALNDAWQYDYAMILVDHPSPTGYLNRDKTFSAPAAMAVGYPAALMQSAVVQAVVGEIFDSSALRINGEPGSNILWHGNPKFTQGASGGAWIAQASSRPEPDKNLVVGVVSHHMSGRPGATFGPRFGPDFETLLKFVSGGCRPDG